MNRPLLLACLFAGAACNNSSNFVSSASGAAACATATACGLVDPVSAHGVSGCTVQALSTNDPIIAAASHISSSIVNCIAAAGANCAAAKRCLGGGATPAACTGNSASCTGTVLSFCADAAGTGGQRAMQKFNCGEVGQMCVVTGATADCGVASCAPGAGGCVGTRIQACQNGILKEYDCALYGSTCVVGALNVAHCRGTGAPCLTQGFSPIGNPLRCEGNVLVRCADSQEARMDCGVDNQLCVAGVTGEPFGCALGSSCTPGSYSATCAGLVLGYCNDGVISSFDCGAYGFKGCSPQNGGTCVP
jgi:hypothetical protein